MTYQQIKELLGSQDRVNYGSAIGGRKGNVWIERRAGGIAVRLHHTDVVLFTPHWIELDTGGWVTPTTRDAICTLSPVQVASAGKSGWVVRLKGESWQDDGHPYYDGIRISTDGARLMRSQPNRPESFTPARTISGFTGELLGYGRRY